MPQINTVIFDMDGVIIDTRELIYRAMEDTLIERDVRNVTRQHMAEVTGKPIHAMYSILAPHLDAFELERAHLAHHDQNMDLMKEYEGIHKVLGYLRESKFKLGIFTGFNELTYDRLQRFQLSDYFDAIVESTQYVNHKPHPEGLLLCIDKLQSSPGEVLYIGDGVSDMLAGKAANVHMTVGITSGFGSQEALEAAGPDYVINSLSELRTILETS